VVTQRLTCAGGSPAEGDLAAPGTLHPDRGLHHLADDRVGVRLGDLLDLHAALRGTTTMMRSLLRSSTKPM
jgi:hypothetical protein